MGNSVFALKCLLTPVCIPGAFYALMGIGVVPLDPHTVALANVFVEPLSVPLKPFLAFLGTCKVLAALSLWHIGPMPRSVAMPGLLTTASCAVHAHVAVGDKPFGAIAYIGMLGVLYVLEGKEMAAKKD